MCAWKVFRSYYEFYVLFCLRKDKFLFLPLLPEMEHETEILANKTKLFQFQNDLEKWLHFLRERPDIVGSEEYQDFLQLSVPEIVEVRSCKQPKAFVFQCQTSGTTRISDILVCENIGVIVCAHEDTDIINKVGVIWNMLQRGLYGELTFSSYDPANFKETKLLGKLTFEQRISKLFKDTSSSIFLIGTDDGELHAIPKEIALNKKGIADTQYRVKLFGGRIVGMSWLVENKILIAAGSGSYIKVFDFSSAQVVGGGSLVQRLDGECLTTMETDPSTGRIFLGTSKNSVIACHVCSKTYQATHLYTICLSPAEDPVSTLLYTNENLFIVYDGVVRIYDVSKKEEPTTFVDFSLKSYSKKKLPEDPDKIVAIAFNSEQNTIIAGCENGSVVCWNGKYGDLIGAYRTGITGGITQLRSGSHNLLLGGTTHSALVIMQMFGAEITSVTKKDVQKRNTFDEVVAQPEEAKTTEKITIKKEDFESFVISEEDIQPSKTIAFKFHPSSTQIVLDKSLPFVESLLAKDKKIPTPAENKAKFSLIHRRD
eukprot:TRINITY_DN3206_c0_g1_i1.p1 TRINITY_DN3206_c0_g1~~TRINITY_DN3206_c0_g1_i1.p1  ORF type:complete len:541 (-),score=76.13 TRINITY_DN3206_c0_g1_i1:224-1846(-)